MTKEEILAALQRAWDGISDLIAHGTITPNSGSIQHLGVIRSAEQMGVCDEFISYGLDTTTEGQPNE